VKADFFVKQFFFKYFRVFNIDTYKKKLPSGPKFLEISAITVSNDQCCQQLDIENGFWH
jgi:hypothetical protein